MQYFLLVGLTSSYLFYSANYKVGRYRYTYHWNTDWNNARQICLNEGGDLVSFENDVELRVVEAGEFGFKYHQYWIGLTDREVEGTWKWTDNSDMKWRNWANGEPKNEGDKDCTYIKENKWYVSKCEDSKKVICKMIGKC